MTRPRRWQLALLLGDVGVGRRAKNAPAWQCTGAGVTNCAWRAAAVFSNAGQAHSNATSSCKCGDDEQAPAILFVAALKERLRVVAGEQRLGLKANCALQSSYAKEGAD